MRLLDRIHRYLTIRRAFRIIRDGGSEYKLLKWDVVLRSGLRDKALEKWSMCDYGGSHLYMELVSRRADRDGAINNLWMWRKKHKLKESSMLKSFNNIIWLVGLLVVCIGLVFLVLGLVDWDAKRDAVCKDGDTVNLPGGDKGVVLRCPIGNYVTVRVDNGVGCAPRYSEVRFLRSEISKATGVVEK